MRFPLKDLRTGGASARRGGFTLAEVLAALAFMAIVIPVAVEGLRVASLAGQLGVRKTIAMRVAERVLNEAVLTAQNQTATTTGTVEEGGLVYRWGILTQSWPEDTMELMTVQVTFTVQGEERAVRLSTLFANASQ